MPDQMAILNGRSGGLPAATGRGQGKMRGPRNCDSSGTDRPAFEAETAPDGWEPEILIKMQRRACVQWQLHGNQAGETD